MLRSIFIAIMLLIGGILSMYGLVIKKAPDLKSEYDKIIPYQGGVGIVLLIIGFIRFLSIFQTLAAFRYSIIGPLLDLLGMTTMLVLGFVLSFGLITKYILSVDMESGKKKKGRKKKGEADWKDKTTSMYNSLTYVQVPFGIIAILLGLTLIIFSIIRLVS